MSGSIFTTAQQQSGLWLAHTEKYRRTWSSSSLLRSTSSLSSSSSSSSSYLITNQWKETYNNKNNFQRARLTSKKAGGGSQWVVTNNTDTFSVDYVELLCRRQTWKHSSTKHSHWSSDYCYYRLVIRDICYILNMRYAQKFFFLWNWDVFVECAVIVYFNVEVFSMY